MKEKSQPVKNCFILLQRSTALQLPLKENTLEADIFIDINTPEDLEYAQEYFHKIHESIRIKYSCIIRKIT
mgnify:CR=1 FL=1